MDLCLSGLARKASRMDAEKTLQRTWQSVLGDHIKDEGLKEIFSKVHPR
jgi:hypothetical protein